MAIRQSDWAKGLATQSYPGFAGQVCAQHFTYAFPLAGHPLNDIIEMCALPAGCVPIDMILDTDDLDSNGAPALALDVGVMSGEFGSTDGARTCGNEFFAAATVAQAAVGMVRPTKKEAFRVAPSNFDRGIGIKIQAAAATPAAGSIGLTFLYASAS